MPKARPSVISGIDRAAVERPRDRRDALFERVQIVVLVAVFHSELQVGRPARGREVVAQVVAHRFLVHVGGRVAVAALGAQGIIGGVADVGPAGLGHDIVVRIGEVVGETRRAGVLESDLEGGPGVLAGCVTRREIIGKGAEFSLISADGGARALVIHDHRHRLQDLLGWKRDRRRRVGERLDGACAEVERGQPLLVSFEVGAAEQPDPDLAGVAEFVVDGNGRPLAGAHRIVVAKILSAQNPVHLAVGRRLELRPDGRLRFGESRG